MANELPVIESFLPYGNSLRELISQSYISAFELKRTLRSRGVFVNANDKESNVPILMSVILSPSEFETLRDKQNTKEDNVKTNSYTIEIPDSNADAKSLLELIPDNIDLNKLLNAEDSNLNYKVDGQPNFHTADNSNGNKIECPYTITRDNLTKDWATNKTKHDGVIVIEKIKENDKTLLKVITKSTSIETKDVGKKFAKEFVSNLKEQKVIDEQTNVREILFSDFTNEGRILFLFNLLSDVGKSNLLELLDITNIEFSPDKSSTMPESLDWLQDKIDQLKLKGKDLFNSTLIKMENRKHFFVSGIEAKYKFEYLNVKGQCSVLFLFGGYSKNENINSELEIMVNTFAFDKGCKQNSKNEYQSKVIEHFEKNKFSLYEKHRIK